MGTFSNEQIRNNDAGANECTCAGPGGVNGHEPHCGTPPPVFSTLLLRKGRLFAYEVYLDGTPVYRTGNYETTYEAYRFAELFIFESKLGVYDA